MCRATSDSVQSYTLSSVQSNTLDSEQSYTLNSVQSYTLNSVQSYTGQCSELFIRQCPELAPIPDYQAFSDYQITNNSTITRLPRIARLPDYEQRLAQITKLQPNSFPRLFPDCCSLARSGWGVPISQCPSVPSAALRVQGSCVPLKTRQRRRRRRRQGPQKRADHRNAQKALLCIAKR